MNRKQFTSLLLIVFMMFTLIAVPPVAVNAEQGTQAEDHDLYLLENVSQKTTVPFGFTGIYSVEDLVAIQEKDRSANYILMKDLDLSGIDWEPLTFGSNRNYAGTFDGNGHTIKNLQAETGDHIALFYGNDGTIENLRISGTVEVYFETLGHRMAASLALENVGTISNCTSSVDFVSSGGSPVDMGGIVVHNGGTITHCRYPGAMRTSSKGKAYFGGSAHHTQ